MFDKVTLPHNMIAIKVSVLPAEMVYKGTLRDFLSMLHTMIDAHQCTLSIDGKPVARVEMFYQDTDDWFIGVKESPLYEHLKYATNFYATPIGIFDTSSGIYTRFSGFNLVIKTKEE